MQNPSKHDEKLTLSNESYESVYEQVSRREEMTDESELDFFTRLVPDGKSHRILDLGCAEGKLAIDLARKGHIVVASDIAEGYLEQVRRNAKSHSVTIETARCDIEKDCSSLAGNEFEYIFFMDVIEHLRSPLTGLENVRRLLSNNGSLFIHTPNACSVGRFYTLLRSRTKTCNNLDPRRVKDLHLQLYDLSSLTQLCNFAGFEVIRVIPTKMGIPCAGNSRMLAKMFPALGDTLLVECKKCTPINVKDVVDYWVSSAEPKMNTTD